MQSDGVGRARQLAARLGPIRGISAQTATPAEPEHDGTDRQAPRAVGPHSNQVRGRQPHRLPAAAPSRVSPISHHGPVARCVRDLTLHPTPATAPAVKTQRTGPTLHSPARIRASSGALGSELLAGRADRICGTRRVTIGRGSRKDMIDMRPGWRPERCYGYDPGDGHGKAICNAPPIIEELLRWGSNGPSDCFYESLWGALKQLDRIRRHLE